MDQKLEDIIARKKTVKRGGAAGRRPRRSGGGSTARSGALGVPDARVQRAKAAATTPSTTSQPVADRIQVSGLPTDVSEGQVKDLFASTIGPLREGTLHHDSNGKSKGIAIIAFNRRADCDKAFQTYNGRLIDGKKPMKIELLFDPSKLAHQTTSLASRVAPAPAAKTNGVKVATVLAGGVQRTGGRGRGRGRARGKGPGRPKKTAEDLDAEMEEYGKVTQVPAAAAGGGDAQMVE